MKRLLARTPDFFRKVRNTAISVMILTGLLGSVSKDDKIKEICNTILVAGAAVGVTAQSAKEEE